jgi:hypothetical protein
VDIQVNGASGAGNAGFDVEALPPSAFNTLFTLGWPLWAGLSLILVAVGWWALMSRRKRDGVQRA